MLKLLNILNLALVHQLRIEFESGLNILTGETGSGKSIVVDSLGLVLGGRSSAELIRSGEHKAHIEAVFHVPQRQEIYDLCAECGIEADLDELLVRREITIQGRGRVFINDQLSTVNFLKALRPYLVDIHGQGDQQTLLHPVAHEGVLDAFGGLEDQVNDVRAAFHQWRQAEKEFRTYRQEESERLRRLDMLAFQCREIETARIVGTDEEAELEAERYRLTHAERLATLATGCYQLLYEDANSVLAQLATVTRRLDELTAIDPNAAEPLSALEGLRYTVEDTAFYLRDYAEQVTFSPARLKQVEDRLAELGKLKRKYGPTLAEVLRMRDRAQEELSKLQAGEAYTSRLAESVQAAAARYLELAEGLSQHRTGAGQRLEQALVEELKCLAMEGTRVVVKLTRAVTEGTSGWRPTGIDEVEFLVSSNIGEELRSLARIASGGEISRFMLALKTITAPTDFPRTMVFDEVDVGIGGRVAEAVGQRLKRLGEHQQVLCVTHLPQIARFGAAHYVVQKKVVGERTETFVQRLTRQHRVDELARMIGGASVTEAARRAAREMLADSSAEGRNGEQGTRRIG